MKEFARRGREAGIAATEVAALLKRRLALEAEEAGECEPSAPVVPLVQGLRVVMLSDTHGKHRSIEVPHGDVLLHAGDFTRMGHKEDATDFNVWLGELPHSHKIVVLGNHEVNSEWNGRAAAMLTNAVLLRDGHAVVPALKDGAPPLRIFGTDFFWASKPSPATLAALATIQPGTVDVLMAHGPAAGFVDGGFGCPFLLQEVERLRPRLVVSGHIHQSHGQVAGTGEVLGSTVFVNAANAQRGHGHMGWPPVVMEV